MILLIALNVLSQNYFKTVHKCAYHEQIAFHQVKWISVIKQNKNTCRDKIIVEFENGIRKTEKYSLLKTKQTENINHL